MPRVNKKLKYEKVINLKELNEPAVLIAEQIASDKKRTKAVIVGLYGDLGSGKTAFVKKIGIIFGIKEKIISPTFTIMRIYVVPAPYRKKFNLNEIIHIDAYRLSGHGEILKLNWPEISKNKKSAIFIEWPERIKKVMPKKSIKIHFYFIDEKTRKVKITANDK